MVVLYDIMDFVNLFFFYMYCCFSIVNDIYKLDCIIFWYNCIICVIFDLIILINLFFDKSWYIDINLC